MCSSTNRMPVLVSTYGSVLRDASARPRQPLSVLLDDSSPGRFRSTSHAAVLRSQNGSNASILPCLLPKYRRLGDALRRTSRRADSTWAGKNIRRGNCVWVIEEHPGVQACGGNNMKLHKIVQEKKYIVSCTNR